MSLFKKIGALAFFFLTVLLVQWGYFVSVYSSVVQNSSSVELMVVYSGYTTLFQVWDKANEFKPAKLLISGVDWPMNEITATRPKEWISPKLLVEGRARTTDQNARYSAPLIRTSGVNSIVLLRPWFHLPRALFLTRLYLRGSGIQVTPVFLGGLPADWWLRKEFWFEMIKFWGSLFRVGLAGLGIEEWPQHLGKWSF